MRIAQDYQREIEFDSPERQEVRITFEARTCSPKHLHLVSCRVEVLSGSLFEIRSDGTKTVRKNYPAGTTLPDLPIGEPHIVGNDGPGKCATLNTYEPALIQEDVPFTPEERRLCGLPKEDD